VSRPEGRRCAAGRLCSRTGSGTWNRGCVAPKSSTCGRAPHHLPVPVGVLNTRRARLMARSQRSRDLREADSRVGLHLVRQCLGAPSCGRGRREHHGASGGDAGGAAEAAAGAIAAMPTHTASCKRFMTSARRRRVGSLCVVDPWRGEGYEAAARVPRVRTSRARPPASPPCCLEAPRVGARSTPYRARRRSHESARLRSAVGELSVAPANAPGGEECRGEWNSKAYGRVN
jgi:hypothetical protein